MTCHNLVYKALLLISFVKCALQSKWLNSKIEMIIIENIYLRQSNSDKKGSFMGISHSYYFAKHKFYVYHVETDNYGKDGGSEEV